jgi:rhamnogalacturonan endolyase
MTLMQRNPPALPSSNILRRACQIAVALGLATTLSAAQKLDRGAAAFPMKDGGVYVGWRLLADDPADVAFDVYRSDSATTTGQKVNAHPIRSSTNFVDAKPGAGGKPQFYRVKAVGKNVRAADSGAIPVGEAAEVGGVKRIKFQGDYKAQKVGVADLDGDGKLDYLIKHPDFNVDPYVLGVGYWKPSPEPYKIEAYRHDGTFMWRHDMGPAIETGIWYSPIVVYDVDGDGKAEVYCKAGPKNPAEIVKHEKGMVMGGPEFLVKLDGATGRELARAPWPDRSGIVNTRAPSEMADYNYQSRNMLGVAYLDGKRPHLIVVRGTYTLIKVRAYDPELKTVWSFDTKGEYEKFAGQGTHGMQVADIDDDGRDEIILGAAAIDDNGKGLWSTGRGHPDACYVGKIDPARPGLQVMFGHEWKQNRDGICLVDARTGETIWGYAGPTTHIHSTGMVADIDPTRPGMEYYGGEANGTQWWVYDARGVRLGNKPMGGLSPVAVWWADSPTKVIVAGGKMFHYKVPTQAEVAALQELTMKATAADVVRNMTKAAGPAKVSVNELWPGYVGDVVGEVPGRVLAITDCLGDWREEVIVAAAGELRIYSTTIPATSRRANLMEDRQYRTSVARQMMGYFYPPILGKP